MAKQARFIPLAVASLLATDVGLFYRPAFSQSIPLYCSKPPSRGLRPEQKVECEKLVGAKTSKPAEAPKQEIVNATYPVKLPSALIIEGKPPVQLLFEAANDTQITLVDLKSKKNVLLLQSKDIVQWVQGDFSGRKFQGGSAALVTASYVGLAAVTAATGGLGAPLFLLAAPFMGMASSNQYIADHRVVVRFINQDTGEIEYATIQLFGKRESLIVADILTTGTGLKASKKRDEDYLRPIRQSALEKQENRLVSEAQKLMIINNKKPWCSKLDLTGKAGDITTYKSILDSVNRLRKQLSLPEYSQNLSASSDSKWVAYLAEKPDMKMWAQSNKQAASKLQDCSKS